MAPRDGNNISAVDQGGTAEQEVAENGKTLGFFSNKNGETALTGSATGTTLSSNIRTKLFAPTTGVLAKDATTSVLVDANGAYQPLSYFSSYANIKTFLLGATATNMANMLSAAQLLTLEFNICLGYVIPTVSVQVSTITIPGTSQHLSSTLQHSLTVPGGATSWTQVTTTDGGAASINTALNAAILQLKNNPLTKANSANRSYQEALKDIFDSINNNQSIFI